MSRADRTWNSHDGGAILDRKPGRGVAVQLVRHPHRWHLPPRESAPPEREETTIFDTVAVITALMVVVALIGALESVG